MSLKLQAVQCCEQVLYFVYVLFFSDRYEGGMRPLNVCPTSGDRMQLTLFALLALHAGHARHALHDIHATRRAPHGAWCTR